MKKKVSFLIALSLIVQMLIPFSMIMVSAEGETVTYTVPASPAETYNMNFDWKFRKADSSAVFPLADASEAIKDANGKYFYEVGYDDSTWETVSVPHPINAEDSFDNLALDSGEQGLYRGFMFYRKNITVPESAAGKKVFIEFEAVRQSVYLYVNGEVVGFYEAGITAMGFDITKYVKPGEENLIAVATDNASARGSSFNTIETKPGSAPGAADGYGYQWNTKDFNEVQGGITGNVNLYIKADVYQTLPLYNNLKTKGNYVYGTDFDIRSNKATINVEAEIRNESGADKDLTLEVAVVNADGTLAYTFSQTGTVTAATDAGTTFVSMVPADAYDAEPAPTDISTVDVSYIKASYAAEGVRFWSIEDPYLYDVYTILKDSSGEVIDVSKITTGFRKVAYDYDGTSGGFKINDEQVYLKGYAQRSTNEWAAIGVANDWLQDIDMQLVRESNANFIRWMHVAPKPNAIRSGDRYGVVSVVPAGDKEADVDGRAWDQRVEAMRDAIIYFRNSPSAIFYEAGNNAISAAHMQEMTDLRIALDPNGGRMMGCRTISSVEQIKAAEWAGTMLGRHGTGAKASMASAGKYIPIVETEYNREESPRRVWDDFSPPDYDYINKWSAGDKQDGLDVHDLTQEDFVLTNINNSTQSAGGDGYSYFYDNRVGASGGKQEYTAAAIMVWSDSNMHNRNTATENCRTSGKVDAIRIKKEAFYALQAAQADEPTINIIGHWNYPQLTEDTYWYTEREWTGSYWAFTGEKKQRDPIHKTVYVIGSSHVDKIELYVNDELVGTDSTPDANFRYAFTDIDVTQSGKVSAKAYNVRGEVIAEDEIVTAGAPASLRLTPVTGPDGLIADGSDVMYYDVEVVDKEGNVCPLNYDKISFQISGEGVFLGGYNSGKADANEVIHEDFVYAENGVNRVFIRSTGNAGTITLKATMDAGAPAEVSLTSVAVDNEGGLSTSMQRYYSRGMTPPPPPPQTVPALKPLAALFRAVFNGENANVTVESDVVIEKDVYAIAINGTNVDLTNYPSPYRQGSLGVVAPAEAVAKGLVDAGMNMTYGYEDVTLSGVTTSAFVMNVYDADGNAVKLKAIPGQTNIYVNDDMSELLNYQIESEDGHAMIEINPYVLMLNNYYDADGAKLGTVTCLADAATKTDNITYQK